jgi:hypothetical protein
MKSVFITILIIPAVISCGSSKEEKQKNRDENYIPLRTDTLNAVHMSDTMIIFESTCRGCAYEGSTEFSISDSTGTVELDHIETHDNSRPDEDGGSISKKLIIVPNKTGRTIIKMYKFWEQPATAKDSANFTSYTIEVKN